MCRATYSRLQGLYRIDGYTLMGYFLQLFHLIIWISAHDNQFHLFVVILYSLLSTTGLYPWNSPGRRIMEDSVQSILSAEKMILKEVSFKSWTAIYLRMKFLNNINNALGSKSKMKARLKEPIKIEKIWMPMKKIFKTLPWIWQFKKTTAIGRNHF